MNTHNRRNISIGLILIAIFLQGISLSRGAGGGTAFATQAVWLVVIIAVTLGVIGGFGFWVFGQYVAAAKKLTGQKDAWIGTEQGHQSYCLVSHTAKTISVWSVQHAQPKLEKSWEKQSVHVALVTVEAPLTRGFPGITITQGDKVLWTGRLASPSGKPWSKNLNQTALEQAITQLAA
jgi:hypothetical protein